MTNFPLNILTFPLWWYTIGLSLMIRWLKRQFWWGLKKTGLLVFVRHMNEPLYGDYTKSGIIISFFIRILLLIFKLAFFTIRLIIVGLMALIFLLLLPLTLIMIIFQILAA